MHAKEQVSGELRGSVRVLQPHRATGMPGNSYVSVSKCNIFPRSCPSYCYHTMTRYIVLWWWFGVVFFWVRKILPSIKQTFEHLIDRFTKSVELQFLKTCPCWEKRDLRGSGKTEVSRTVLGLSLCLSRFSGFYTEAARWALEAWWHET